MKTAPDIHVFEGRVCSGDQFIASRAQKDSIVSEFGGLCREIMEGAAIAQVCCLNEKALIVFPIDNILFQQYNTIEKQIIPLSIAYNVV